MVAKALNRTAKSQGLRELEKDGFIHDLTEYANRRFHRYIWTFQMGLLSFYHNGQETIKDFKKYRLRIPVPLTPLFRFGLTPSRALLLSVLYDLVSQGEYVSEFASEKVCYFLQRFGAEQHLKLEYQPYFYGPYSGKVRFLLDKLNGSYIMGYSDMSKKPFAPLTLISDSYQDVESYIRQNTELSEIAEKTKAFLNGFYSDFSLELLSSVDFIAREYDTLEFAFIQEKLNSWNDRKRSLFSNANYLKRTITHINQYQEVL